MIQWFGLTLLVNHGFAIWINALVDVPLYSLPLIVS